MLEILRTTILKPDPCVIIRIIAKITRDTHYHANALLFACKVQEKGVNINILSEPTKLELLQQQYNEKCDELMIKARDRILNRYGGKQHLDALPSFLLLAQTEHYIEYSRYGKIYYQRTR